VTGGSYESLLGQKVQVSGSLFSAHTGHHHTRVLLTVASLRAATEFTSASASDGLCPNAVTTLEINRCLSKEIAHAESDLNRYLAEARRLLAEESEAAAALDRAQASWLAYRDADCNAVFELYAQGTIRGPMGGGCKLIRTQRRIHDIWETYLRSTDAPLPEPKKP